MKRPLIISLVLLASCRQNDKPITPTTTYGSDLTFLQQHDKSAVELASSDGNSRMIVSPKYQGRVMTTTADGLGGTSYGWINYDLISSGEIKKQFNPVGGEERFWLGPEGGQFSLYFAPGDSFEIEKWQVPPIIDTVTYQVKSRSDNEITVEAKAQINNRSGTTFDIAISRTVGLLSREDLEDELDVTLGPNVKAVAYRTVNTITNAGRQAWSYEKGLISIWLLGMFTPSASTEVIVPIVDDADRSLITTDYFGDIPSDRLVVQNSALTFKCDGKFRSKIGLPLAAATGVAGSWDAERGILTIVMYDVDNYGSYVNSKWQIHEDPYKGDVFNSYNDGPLADGSQLGPFYELESSSPVFPLKPEETQSHSQVTFHFEGDFEFLNILARTFLHTDLNEHKPVQ